MKIAPIRDIAAKFVKACVFNVQYIQKKAQSVNEYIVDNNFDIVTLIETWLRPDNLDQVVIAELCPPGYTFANLPRQNGSGYGGLGIVYRDSLQLKVDIFYPVTTQTFEILNVSLSDNYQIQVKLSVLYRPPPSKKNGYTTATFFKQFSELIDTFPIRSDIPIIVGDLNLHLDKSQYRDANIFKDMLFSSGLIQHVNGPTHRSGHTMDVVISRETDDIIYNVTSLDPLLSDHSAVHFVLKLTAPPPETKSITYRKYVNIDQSKWKDGVHEAFKEVSSASSCKDLLTTYNSNLNDLLNVHAPLQTKVLRSKSHSPWISQDIRSEVQRRCLLEKKWRKSGLTVHKQMYKQQINMVNKLISEAKRSFYSSKIEESSQDPKALFKTVDVLLNRKPACILLTEPATTNLAETFAAFFDGKIRKIRSAFEPNQVALPYLESDGPSTVSPFT